MKKLYEFQKIALENVKQHNRFLLALDMGLGKTFTSLKWLQYLKETKGNNLNTLILVASKKVKDWIKELNDLGFNYVNKIETLEEQVKFQNLTSYQNEIWVISYQRFCNILKQNKLLLSWKSINLIIDESQVLKNPKTLISKTILKYDDSYSNVSLLSGDPISKGYQNLFVQMKLLGLFDTRFKYDDFLYYFTNTYTLPNTRIQVIKDYKNVDKLMNLLRQKSYFLKTKDAIDLPKKNYFFHKSQLDKSYKVFKDEKSLITETFQLSSDNFMSYFHNLRLLSSGMALIKKDNQTSYAAISTDKIEQLKILLTSSTFNFTLFYNYKCELHFIKQLLTDLKIKFFQINGEFNELEKALSYKDRQIVLIHYASGARGVDGLQQIAFNQIYFSPPTSGELFKQSLKRIHRIGQDHPVNYHFLIAPKSIEVNIYKQLQLAQDYTETLFKQDFIEGEKTWITQK